MQTDLKLARKLLETQLKEASSSRRASDSIRIQQVADPVEMTQEAVEQEIAVQIFDRESTLVRRLRSAIDRIDDGSYGFCLQCDEEIAPKRLRAVPWAELCIGCQEATENLAGETERTSWPEERSEAA